MCEGALGEKVLITFFFGVKDKTKFVKEFGLTIKCSTI